MPTDPLSMLTPKMGEVLKFTVTCSQIPLDSHVPLPGMGDKLVKRVKTEVYQFPGLLAATDRRMAFIHRRGDPEEVGGHVVKDIIGYDSIQSVTVERRALKGHALFVSYEVDGVVHGRGYLGEGLDLATLSQIRTQLMGLQRLWLKRLAEERDRERVQYVIDFSFLKDQMERGGLAVAAVKCPNCSSSVTIPSSGEYFTCEYCNSTIRAMDVFERMRQFIEGL